MHTNMKLSGLIYLLQIILCGYAELLTINVQNQVRLYIKSEVFFFWSLGKLELL